MNATRRELPGDLLAETVAFVPDPTSDPDAATCPDPLGGGARSTPEPRGAHRFTFGSGARPLDGYTIKRAIGRGGFGEVYYATSDAGKEVALKLLTRHIDIERRGVLHCMNLKSPHLITIFDLRTNDEDDTFVVMEYVSGVSLAQLLVENPDGLPPLEVRRWLKGLVEGVAYLHDHGIVHRDLKPANLFLEEGVVKIGDYGLSKSLDQSQDARMSENVGTCYYMAPEIASGKYHKPIDIYAMGVILYEMITGQVPFEGESAGEVLMKHLTAMPDLAPLSEPYRSIISRALAKDPAHRPARPYDLLPPEDAPRTPEIRIIGRDGAEPEPSVAPTRREPEDVLVIGDEEPILYIGPDTMPPPAPRARPRRARLATRIWQPRPSRPAPAVASRPAASTSRPAPAPPPPPSRPAPPAPTEPPPLPSGRVRVAELAGSMLWAAPLAALGSSICLAMYEPLGIELSTDPVQLAFLFLMVLLGAWAVLIPQKLWEGRNVPWLSRRLVMGLVGLGLGVTGVALASWTRLHPSPIWQPDGPMNMPVGWVARLGPADQMAGLGFAAYFALLFALLPTRALVARDRPRRFRFLPVIGTLLLAVLAVPAVTALGAWGPAVFALIALTVQLVSPWNREAARYSVYRRWQDRRRGRAAA